MAKALLVASSTSALASGDECNLFGYGADSTSEANTQASCTEGATFSNLRANIISGGSGTNNFQFRDAGANGSQLATRAGTGVCEDAVNTDTLSAGDLFNIAYTDTGTNSTCSWIAGNVEMASGYGAFIGAAGFGGTVFDAPSSTRFICLAGGFDADGDLTEANVSFKARGFTSWEAVQVRVVANARTNPSFFGIRIAGATQASFEIEAGETGLLTLTGIGEAISDGDTLCCSLELDTGVEDLTIALAVATFKSSNTKQDIWTYSPGGEARTASSTAHYCPIGGNFVALGTYTEAQARIKPGYAGTASNIRCYLSANTYGGDGTLKLYQNGSAVITLTLGAGGGAGWYENTSDSVSFDADDEFSFEFDEGTSGSITIKMVGLTLAPTVEGGGGFVRPPRGLDAGTHVLRGGMQ